jgi:hypothetical protein
MTQITEQELAARKLLYDQYQEDKRYASQLQAEFGKWLVASLLLIHGAAFAFAAQDNELSAIIFKMVFWPHILGILFALGSGLSAWLNWGFHVSHFVRIDPRMIYDNQFWPKFESSTNKWIGSTYWASILFGMASALMVLVAAWIAYCRLV